VVHAAVFMRMLLEIDPDAVMEKMTDEELNRLEDIEASWTFDFRTQSSVNSIVESAHAWIHGPEL
jgi:hypothetical protein